MNLKESINHNYIIERFKKGEISIADAFNQLTKTDNNPNINNLYSIPGKKNDNSFQALDKSVQSLNGSRNINNNQDQKENNEENVEIYLREMDKLVGLDTIKSLILEYIALIKVQKMREEYNLKTIPVVMHMIFKGNPGTGKTTMARIIARIFKVIGFLKNGEVIEAERADLVGEYIGHTAQKTRKLIQKAIGGVLFIDEAYSLARGGEKDFGKESIDTIVKAMEDFKDNLIIILAGYKDEMEFFLQTNPGLRSRFAIQIDFPDYSIDELVMIAELMYQEREYILDDSSKHYIYNVLTKVRNNEKINGNARTVRNLVERSIRLHASRIIKKNNINRSELMKICKEDFGWEEFRNGRMSGNRDV